jgi:hypothetical protein
LTGDVTSSGNTTTLTNAPVIAKVLTGYASGSGTVLATDSILQAFQKLNGNDGLKANLASPTFTGTPTLPTGTIATTQTAADSTTAVATTAFVTTADNLKQNLPVGAAWTPTLGVGSWTLMTFTGRYVQANKLVQFWILGTATGACVLSSGVTPPFFNFPVAAQNVNAGNGFNVILIDISASVSYTGTTIGSSNLIRPMVNLSSGTYTSATQISTTVPMTWASGDTIFIQGTYEAA